VNTFSVRKLAWYDVASNIWQALVGGGGLGRGVPLFRRLPAQHLTGMGLRSFDGGGKRGFGFA